MIQPWLDLWALRPDGPPLRTRSSVLQPVRDARDRAGMLKLAEADEERFGNGLMIWWAGDGAAPVWAADGPALLMARAGGGDLLDAFRDPAREAEGIAALTGVLARLHRPRPGPPLDAIPMAIRCAALLDRDGPAADLARRLLDDPADQALLHGDAHPGNMLNFGTAADPDWRAIDPKRVRGPRAYDLAAVLVTPDLPPSPARLDRMLPALAAACATEARHLRAWTAVSAALSAAWSAEDGDDPRHARTVEAWALAGL